MAKIKISLYICYFILCYLYLYREEYYRRGVCVKRCASLDLYALGYCWRIQRAASPQPSPLRGEGADGERSPAVSFRGTGHVRPSRPSNIRQPRPRSEIVVRMIRGCEPDDVGNGKEDTGYLYKPFMIAQC